MKRLTCLIITMFTLQVIAANKEFTSAMTPLLEKGNSVTESTQFRQLAEEFASLAVKHPKEWLPLYYAAYHYTNAAEKNEDGTAQAVLYNKAEDYIAKGLNVAPEQSEFFVLRAYVLDRKQKTTAKINNSEWLIRFNQAINDGKKYGPENPRAYLVSAMHLIYQPGKIDEARIDAERALKLYDREVENLHPDWGKNLAISLAGKLQNN